MKYVVDKFRHKLPKEQVKTFAKDVNKKLVSSDYKNHRVEDPTSISSKQEKKVKKYVKDFFDRAVVKYNEHEKRKAERAARDGAKASGAEPDGSEAGTSVATPIVNDVVGADDDIVMSDVEDVPASSPERKRKREDEAADSPSITPEEPPSVKRLKEDESEAPSPPPPPPPPPADAAISLTVMQADDLACEQDENPVHENEEAQKIADAAEQDRVRQEEALQRENEEAMRDFEIEQEIQHAVSSNGDINAAGPLLNGGEKARTAPIVNGTALEMDPMELDNDTAVNDGVAAMNEARKQEVVGH